MNQNNGQNNQGNGQKKAKSDFVVACNGVKLAIKGRLARAHIVSTFDYQNKGFPKHSTYLIVDPNDPKVRQLAQACQNIKQQFFPNMPDLLWSNPIKDARTQFKPDGSEWQDWQKGNVFIAVSTGAQFPPTALIKDVNAPKGYREANVLDEKNFYYDGADAVVEFAAGGMEGNNKGINLYFNGIIALGTGDRIVIASSGSFNADEAFAEFLGGTAGGNNNSNQNNNGQNNQNHSNGYQGNGNQGYQGNGQQNQGANSGMNGNGQQNHGNQTQGYHQGGNGQNAQNGASHSNQNQNYNNNQNYQNNNGGSLV
jgi:hypothetical protein